MKAEFTCLSWLCSSTKFPISTVEALLSLSLTFVLTFQQTALELRSVVSNKSSSFCMFIEIHSQENAINTFSNVNDPVSFFEKYFD